MHINSLFPSCSTVVRECQLGTKKLKDQIVYAKQLFNYKVVECEQRTGIPYFSDEKLTKIVVDLAEKEGFEKECKLNNKDVINAICAYRCTPNRPKKIAELSDVSLNGVSNQLYVNYCKSLLT